MTAHTALRSRRAVLAGGTAIAASAGLGWSGSGRAQAGPLKIGWLRPTTGRLVSSFAPLYVSGQIAIKEINEGGGILGRQLVIQEEDDEGSPAKEPAAVRKLQDAGVTVVCGPTGTSQVLASLGSTTPAKMIQAGIANTVELSDGDKYPYHYHCAYTTVQEANRFVDFLVKKLGKQKVGILQESTGFGEQGAAATVQALERLGLKPASLQVYPITAPDLGPYVTNLRNSGADCLALWIGTLPGAGMAFRSMGALKWAPPIVGHSFLLSDSLFDLVSPDALQSVYAAYYRPLTWTAREEIGDLQRTFGRKLADYPEAKRIEAIVPQAPLYDFLYLLKGAVEAEKSFDVEAIKRRLDTTSGHKGLLGTFTFTPKNHSGIADEDVVLASVLSGRDARAQGPFRERAPE